MRKTLLIFFYLLTFHSSNFKINVFNFKRTLIKQWFSTCVPQPFRSGRFRSVKGSKTEKHFNVKFNQNASSFEYFHVFFSKSAQHWYVVILIRRRGNLQLKKPFLLLFRVRTSSFLTLTIHLHWTGSLEFESKIGFHTKHYEKISSWCRHVKSYNRTNLYKHFEPIHFCSTLVKQKSAQQKSEKFMLKWNFFFVL